MAKTNDEFILEISQISPEIEITGKYTKATERISVRCRQCGHVWNPLAYSLSQGKSCPHCSAKRGAKKTKEKPALNRTINSLLKCQTRTLPLWFWVNISTDIQTLNVNALFVLIGGWPNLIHCCNNTGVPDV